MHEINNSYIQFSEECGEIIVDKVFVDPSQRGHKIGHKLLEVALDYAREQGMNLALCAEPDEDMPKDVLIEYYEEFGFEQDADCAELMTYYT